LQRQGNLLVARKCAAVPEYLRTDRGETLEGYADAAAGDFFREFIDGEADLGHRVVRTRLEKVRRNLGKDIAEAKEDFLLVIRGFRSGFRCAGGVHANGIVA